ncbi:MAG: helix-turn-helix domain-containing protein [Ktedonobacteraceae bacterium]|nr:helix-turn-helix domain-containing protein [Ktedonobacteraceae bacterium]
MENQLELLLKHAELQVVEFNVHQRREMQTFNRTLPYYILSYHKKGYAQLRVGDQHYTVAPGMVICIPPYVEHDHYKGTHEESVFLWWHFKFQIAGVVDVMKMFSLPLIFRLHDSERFEQVFHQFMESTAPSRYLPSTILKQAKAWELLYIILDSVIELDEADDSEGMVHIPSQSFLSILCQIVQHPERQLSLQGLADELHMHPTYICNRFKELFGKSPIQMQREMKIQRAKTLLETTELPVTKISQVLGYNEVQNFTRLFKSYVGVSPSQFRNLNIRWREAK